jgi:hypothetical protein
LRLERSDVGPHRIEILRHPGHLDIERNELVARDERLRVDDLRE